MTVTLTGMQVSVGRACLRELITNPDGTCQHARPTGVALFQGLPKHARLQVNNHAAYRLSSDQAVWIARAIDFVLDQPWTLAELQARTGGAVADFRSLHERFENVLCAPQAPICRCLEVVPSAATPSSAVRQARDAQSPSR